jgi:uncharacterized protein
VSDAPRMRDTRAGAGRRSPLLAAVIAVLGVFALLVAAIALFGSAKDGNPQVTLPLPPFARTAVPLGPAKPPAGAARLINGNLVFDPALSEDTPQGPLPIIGADGRKPMEAYAPAFDPSDKRPRIAVVVTGLGVSSIATTLALGRLPPAVTLAFSPYGSTVQTWVDGARGNGHEVLIEVAMEPFDFPDSDPGPRTLLVAASTEENAKRLSWILTRFTGYAGAVNSQGGRFLSETKALEPVVRFLAGRGVLWVDVSTGEKSATAGAASREKAAAVAGALGIDDIQTPEAIDAKLLDLEARAKESGTAVGVASAYPVSIDRIAEWIDGAQSRGFVLVPVTAVAKRNDATHAP